METKIKRITLNKKSKYYEEYIQWEMEFDTFEVSHIQLGSVKPSGYNKWVEKKWIALSHNYNSRNINSSFDKFCNYIYEGIINKVEWMPGEYTTGIKGETE